MQGVSIGRGFFGQQRLRCCREEELTTALVHKGALCITAKSDRRGPKLGHSRPGRASSKSGHVRCALKAEVNSEHLMIPRPAIVG